ncbi:uncharacterized mitochondrial protein-like protein [Tanacetum coccineum]
MGFKEGKLTRPYSLKGTKVIFCWSKFYVDDIIFGSTKKELCIAFEKLMHEKFQMSSMGELTFFLGLQVQQKKDGIFISQDKYVVEILKKFGFTKVKTASTPMETQKPLLKDEDGEEVEVHMYSLMIGSLMYLTSSRPDIMFAVCACARYQVNPKVLHLHAVKRIFRYLKGQPKLGLWYPKYSLFNLVTYTDSDYAGASLDIKSTTGGKAKKSVNMMLKKRFEWTLSYDVDSKSCCLAITYFCWVIMWFWSTVKAKTINGEVQLHALVDGKKIIITESTVRRDLQLEDAERSKGPLVLLDFRSSAGRECQENPWGGSIFQTRFENVSKHSNDLLLAKGNTLHSDEDRLKLDELMALCTTLQNRVLDLEKTKTTQANEIASLKRRVKKLKKKDRSRTHKLKRLYKVGLTARVESSGDEESLGEDASKQERINAIDADEEITLVSVQDDADKEMFDVDALNGEEVFVAGQNENVVEEVVDVAQVSTAATTVIITTEEITLDQALEALKTSKPKPMKKKDLIRLDEEVALKLQAEFDEEERLAREKAEKSIQIEDFRTELVEGKEKRARTELAQEITKMQKVEDDKETAEIKKLMEIIPDE